MEIKCSICSRALAATAVSAAASSLREWHFAYALAKDFLALLHGPERLPPCECVCTCAGPVGAQAAPSACDSLERLVERQLAGASAPWQVSISVTLTFAVSFSLVAFLVGYFLGTRAARSSARAESAAAVAPRLVAQEPPVLQAAGSPPRTKGGKGVVSLLN